jgi:hypothetical protein
MLIFSQKNCEDMVRCQDEVVFISHGPNWDNWEIYGNMGKIAMYIDLTWIYGIL